MIQVDERKWKVHDPDNILNYQFEGFDVSVLQVGGAIHPREDLILLTHKESNYIVDFGYYGCEVELDGVYAVHVLDGSLDDSWHQPLERHESKTFLTGISDLQSMITKYT